MKCRLYKRSRQKFHEIQESFRENVRLRSSEDSKNKNDAEKASGESNQHSPESVLYESDSCLCIEKLSPEIILKPSKIKSQTEIQKNVIDDSIEGSSSKEYRESNLLMCDFDIESRDDFVNLERYYPKGDTQHYVDDPLDLTDSIYSCSLPSLNNMLNSDANETMDVTHDRQSSAVALEDTTRQRISPSEKLLSNLESQSCNDSGSANFCNKHHRRFLEKNSNQEKNCKNILGTMDNCYSLDKTFSMNDDLMREMTNYLEEQSLTIANQSIMEKTCKLQEESTRFAIFQEIEKRSGFTDDVGHLSSDELAGLSVDRSIEDDDSPNNKKRRKEIPSDNKRFDLTLEKIGERLTANWSEFCKRFAYLQQVGRQICGENSEHSAFLLHKMFPYISVSTLFPSCTPPSSPDNRNVEHNFIKDGEETKKIQDSESKTRLEVNFCGESLTKRFRNAKLIFDYEGEVKKQRQSEIRTEITDSLLNKSEECSLLDSSSCDKKQWDNISESTFDLATAINYDDHNNNLRKVMFYSYIFRV